MPIEMPRGLPFSVDTWSPCSKRKRHHFLTHAHKDHCFAISTHSSYPIYSTLLTKSLLFVYFPEIEDSLFVCIEVGQSLVIDDPDGEFKVTAFDANHCPGAVMFLFEGSFGNILHTGDCRLTPECLQCLPEKFISKNGKKPRCQLEYVFLDCTFGRSPHKFPSRHTAIQQVINCVWKHPAATRVYLTCDLLGQEDILVNVSCIFGSKIYVDKAANLECFLALTLTVPEILTQDPSSRFHIFDGFPKLYERAAEKLAEARANLQPEPLIIRPSAQFYACGEEYLDAQTRKKLRFNEALMDQFGIWHVCYSIHSSREELEWALQLLAPKWVISTTPPCRSVELDYVKRNCSGHRLTSDDPLWKLLDISAETSPEASLSVKNIVNSPVIQDTIQISEESQLQPVKACSREFLSLSPPSKRLKLTLFGKARLGIQGSDFAMDDKSKIALTRTESSQSTVNKQEQEVPFHDTAELKCESKLENMLENNDVGEHGKKTAKEEVNKVSSFLSLDPQRTSVIP
ncbi:hypothetical protein K2173_027507 [Erythroxylum novogranatense]|uniref:DNA repair metallo-beta-lactamase domain-containing protein n=1 Tax=Erythroxylum novogranatense TaxID=1862640 RepID=A0AAV8TZE2_9ROSI|nr:hypothetical protein K2173_027507 [Erythroxylum novogranatense]